MLLGAPPWLMKDQYVIDARVSLDDIEAWQRPDPEKKMLRGALQQMLMERCNLVLHRTTTEQPVYALVIKPGAKLKLKEVGSDEVLPEGAIHIPYDGGIKERGNNNTSFYKISMNYVIAYLTANGADRPVVDMTELKGRYDFVLPLRPPEESESGDPKGPWDLESVGLILKPLKLPLETLVIDHVEQPTSN